MKAKVKSGDHLLFTKGYSNKWDNLKDKMIINFLNKNTYINFKQKDNHLFIETTEGMVDIVFTGEIPELTFDHFEKEQLVLNIS
jgi:hypothetical protein